MMNKAFLMICLTLLLSHSIQCQQMTTVDAVAKKRDNDSPCPIGWLWVKNLEKCFFFSTKTVKWRIARKICMQQGGTLLRIFDEATWNFLKSEIPRHYLPEDRFYIGLSDIINDGTYEWEHSMNEIHHDGLFNKYIYPYYGERWCSREPNGTQSLECVALRIEKNSICYEDRNCSLESNYGCEMRTPANDLIVRTATEVEKVNQTLHQTMNEIEKYRQVLKSTVNKLATMASRVTSAPNSSQKVEIVNNNNGTTSKYCLTERNRYIKGQMFKKDECTNCLCKENGVIVCEKLECELKECADASKPRYFSGVCCPLCEHEVKTRYPYLNRISKQQQQQQENKSRK